jgi:hypothetical protein
MDEGVIEKLKQARANMDAGKPGGALGLLGDIATATRDPELLRQMHSMAENGLAQAGRFSKGPWKHVLADLDEQMRKVGADKEPVEVSD